MIQQQLNWRIARGTVKGERMARQLENKQLQSTLQFWERTARNIQRGSKTFGEDVGKAINTTLNGKDKGLFAIRRNNASKNFGEVLEISIIKPGRIKCANNINL